MSYCPDFYSLLDIYFINVEQRMLDETNTFTLPQSPFLQFWPDLVYDCSRQGNRVNTASK